MTIIELEGLDGTNPLHVLAAFGALLLSDDLDGGGARLGWKKCGGTFKPRIETSTSESDWCRAVAERLRAMGVVKIAGAGNTAKKEVENQKKKVTKLADGLKGLRSELASEAKKRGLGGPEKKAHGQARLVSMQQELKAAKQTCAEAEEALSAALGFGMAHLGEIIGVPAQIFRQHAEHALKKDPAAARQLSALASDGCLKEGKQGNVSPTHYSFSNGASSQKLLKDFRALALLCTEERVRRSALLGTAAREDKTALNWEPAALRSHAHQWLDPGLKTTKKEVDVAANALAYVGLGLLTCFPGKRELEVLGFVRRNPGSGFTWPLWDALLPVEVIRATVASLASKSFADNIPAMQARGLLGIQTAARINPTKQRNYFAPSSPRKPSEKRNVSAPSSPRKP